MKMGGKPNGNMFDKRQKMLATESVGKLLFKLAIPAAIGMFVMSLYNVVDTIFIGQVVGTPGIAGLTIVFPVQMIVMGLGMMIGIGSASLISRSLGAGDMEKAEKTVGNAMFSTVAIGVTMAIIGLSNVEYWAKLFGASDAILPYATGYMNIILIGMIFQVFAMGTNQLVRSEGNARVPMISMIIGAGLNIALDAVFILALDMGVQGAAMATVISQMVTCAYVLHYYLFRDSTLKIRIKNLIPDWIIIRGIIAIGVGPFVMSTGGSLVMAVVNNTLQTYGGDVAIASFGMVNRIMMFIFMPIMCTGQGLQPILGFSYGAKKFDRALASLKTAMITATIFACISFLLIRFVPGLVLHIFTSDTALIDTAAEAAKKMFLLSFMIGFQMIGSVFFQAIGKVVPTFITSTSRQILFFLPAVLILPNFIGIDGVWYSFPIADGLAVLLTLALFIPQLRMFRKEATAMRDGSGPGSLPPDTMMSTRINSEEQADIAG